jgi:hypothetical protein
VNQRPIATNYLKFTPDFVGTDVSETKLYVYGGYVTAPAREKQDRKAGMKNEELQGILIVEQGSPYFTIKFVIDIHPLPGISSSRFNRLSLISISTLTLSLF